MYDSITLTERNVPNKLQKDDYKMKNFKSYRTKFEIVKRNMTHEELINLFEHCLHLNIGYDVNEKYEESEFFGEMCYVIQTEIDKRKQRI